MAAENGTRPAGVVTFRGHDPVDLAGKLQYVINERHTVVASIPPPEIHDTLREEIAVLTGVKRQRYEDLHVLHHSMPHIDGYSIRSKQIVDFQRSIGIDVRVLTSAQHEVEVGRPRRRERRSGGDRRRVCTTVLRCQRARCHDS